MSHDVRRWVVCTTPAPRISTGSSARFSRMPCVGSPMASSPSRTRRPGPGRSEHIGTSWAAFRSSTRSSTPPAIRATFSLGTLLTADTAIGNASGSHVSNISRALGTPRVGESGSSMRRSMSLEGVARVSPYSLTRRRLGVGTAVWPFGVPEKKDLGGFRTRAPDRESRYGEARQHRSWRQGRAPPARGDWLAWQAPAKSDARCHWFRKGVQDRHTPCSGCVLLRLPMSVVSGRRSHGGSALRPWTSPAPRRP